ncbi:copper homeostasis protein CutC [Vibrio mexicanus]|uniref:copper homeostasis protein CutC n=1 Tax=Vibrio mexicanus TaxID=1004326 RepID=UPI00063C6A3B|nr:copper homeostasis protein CutC [Vibrio mexicanus]
MRFQLEVCIDNLESLHNAIAGGATRIELCSSLALGGLTPSFGFMKQAARYSSIPIYAIIRPREGDFLYSEQDYDAMLLDIDAAHEAGLNGVVIGALTANGDIDMPNVERLTKRAQKHGLGITFHRAIDQCRDVETALEQIISLGCERVLTSGLAKTAQEGKERLKRMHLQANGRIKIMAGAGLNHSNVLEIVAHSGIDEVHLSGKSSRSSEMTYLSESAKMGNGDDYSIPVTDSNMIRLVDEKLRSLN